MASLQDQLLKAGIVDSKQAKKIQKDKRKEAKSRPKGQVQPDEAKELARQALADKAERARELNRQQQAQSDKKAIQAQIIQLIKMNRISRDKGEVAYQFTDGKKIKKMYVTARLQDELSRGRIAIARLGEAYELIPAPAAEKILQRDQQAIVVLNQGTATTGIDEEDPYADYQIPDDLMW